jgi:tripartite-type tricarboxylate transporter receptor subunit TctC
MIKKAISLGIGAAIMILLSGWSDASAQEKFPNRPITFVIPWAAGGGGTVNAQALQPGFEKAIGTGMMIANKPGGGGTIGWNFVANSPPDGYTVAIVNPSLVVTAYTIKTGISYKKFDSIIYTVGVPGGVAVREDSPWKTFKEFISYAKANPGKVQMAQSGHGAMNHIGLIGIEMVTGVKFTFLPYKGSAPCATALVGGHVDGTMIEISTLLPFVQAKKIRILAVSSSKRSPILPDVPTFQEHGFDLDVGTWYGYSVPKGTPKDRIKVLHDAFKVGMETKEFKDIYQKQGGIVEYRGPDGLTAHFENQDRLWKKIIDFGGFKPEN